MSTRLDKIRNMESAANPKSRRQRLRSLEKSAEADQHGIFQHFQSNVTEYATRERYLSMRGGEAPNRTTEGLYNLTPEHEDSYVPTEYVATHLSTRYSPDRVGIQARRIADGVFQDPYTNKIYDYNEGFKAEDGRTFPPGSAALQSSMMHLASHLDEKGLVKEADYLDALIKKAAGSFVSTRGPDDNVLSLEDLRKLDDLGWQREDFADVDKTSKKVREALGLSGATEKLARPLMPNELALLFKAHEDPSSDYKITADRIIEIDGKYSNLTDEEIAIVDGLTLQASVRNNLIAFASHLDLRGLTEEADKLDCIIRRAK